MMGSPALLASANFSVLLLFKKIYIIAQLSIIMTPMFQIIPIDNMNGRVKVEEGNMCERKNGRGVDPNRNFEVDFGVKEKDYNP